MRIAIAVHGDPRETSASRSALAFSRAVVAAGHQIPRVFFYHAGIHAGETGSSFSPEHRILLEGWSELHSLHGIELAVCITAAGSRSVFDASEAERQGERVNLHPSFELVGLGQQIEAILHADRLVTFAA